LRSLQSCSYSKTSQHFMEPECSLPCSQEPSAGPCSESSIQSIQHNPISLRSILILSTQLPIVLPNGSFLFAFQPILYLHSSSPHSCYVPCPSHPPGLDHSNYTWRRVQVIKLLIMRHPSSNQGLCFFSS
jgi:hypothetical protein